MFYVRRTYYCPHCRRRQWFFSFLPVLGPRWRCRGCNKEFDLDAVCIGSNWAVVAGMWGLPLSLAAGELFAVVEVVWEAHMRTVPVTKEIFLRDILGPLVCGGPVLMFIGSVFGLFGGYFAGLVYGFIVTKR